MADNPITRKEKYLAKLTGSYTGNVPDPITRVEKYLYDLCQKGISGLTPEEIENAVNKYLKENPVQSGATTEQAQQIEQNKTDIASLKTETASLKEDLSTKITKFYASSQGETHLADSDNGKIMDMMLYGKSEQKQYSGKNLLNYDAWKRVLITRGTAVFEKNSFTLTATENDCYTEPVLGQGFPDDAKIEISEGETITLSWESSANTDGNIYIFPNGVVTDGLVYSNNHNTKTLTYTAARGVKFITFRFGVAHAGDTISYKNIQIEKGSEATAFEPYTGGIPSPNPDYPQEIKSVVNPTVKIVGKNLLKATLQTTTKDGVTCTANGDGTYTLNGTATATGIFILHSNIDFTGQMRLCGGTSLVSLQYSNSSNFAYEDKGTGIIIEHFDSVTYPNASFNILIKANDVYNNVLVKPMLTTDLTATYDDYEPYREQTVTIPYTLNALPVSADGNVTIDGQQYVSDYVDVERGKLVKKIKEISKDPIVLVRSTNNPSKKRFILGNKFLKAADNFNKWSCKCSNLQTLGVGTSATYGCVESCGIDIFGDLYVYYEETSGFTTAEEFKAWWEKRDIRLMGIPETPTETDLTPEEIAAFKALATYYPITNISINSEQLDGYTVFNYPISMQNGWNYVKQQIGDTRDYIYGMDARTQDTDLQAAEAYVNSEYAVALTELEV